MTRPTGGLAWARRATDKFSLTCAVVSILCLIVTGFVAHTTRHNTASVQQVCDLVINAHADKVHRYVGTIDYLATSAGSEHTALNDYIRERSLPQTFAEVTKERENLPPTCVAGRKLPRIPPLPKQ